MQHETDKDPMSVDQQPHQAWLELLPFLANDSLQGAERDEIEAHLASCLTCRAELAAEQRLLRAFRGVDAEAAQADDSFARILARARAEDAPPAANVVTPRRGWGRRVGPVLARRLALVATLSAVVLGLAQLGPGTPSAVQGFRTLSQDHGKVVGADIVYVALDPALAMGSVEDSLRAVQAELVSGPTADHVYTVRVPRERLAQAVATLAAREGIRFVAPAAPDAASPEVAR